MSVDTSAKKVANPGPLGLLGFGMTTVLLNLSNAGIMKFSIIIIAMGLALGGTAQIIAGIAELCVGNTFGGLAFSAYGLFWWSFCLIVIGPFKASAPAADGKGLGFYLLLWGIFTLFMFVGTFAHNTVTKVVFGSLALLFFLLAIGNFANSSGILKVAGWVGIVCGLSAVYSAVGQVVNGELGKKLLPL